MSLELDYFISLKPIQIINKSSESMDISITYLDTIQTSPSEEMISKLFKPITAIHSRLFKNSTDSSIPSSNMIHECLNVLTQSNSDVMLSYFANSFVNLINNGVFSNMYSNYELLIISLLKIYNNIHLKRLFLALFAWKYQDVHFKIPWICYLPDNMLNLLTKSLIENYSKSSETAQEKLRFIITFISPTVNGPFKTIKPKKKYLSFLSPLEILENLNEFTSNDYMFATHCLNLAFCFSFQLFSAKSNIDPDLLMKLSKFFEIGETARGAFCHVLYIACLNQDKPQMIVNFLNNMNSPLGRTIMQSLFTFNTSKEYCNLISKHGHLFYQYFYRNHNFYSDIFNISVKPLISDMTTEIFDQKILTAQANVNMYLQYILNILVHFYSMSIKEKNDFIENNLVSILQHINTILKLLFDIPNIYTVQTIDSLATIFSMFFDILGKIFDPDHLVLSPISKRWVDSVLLALKYIITAQIPSVKTPVYYHSISAFNSILNFISENGKSFYNVISISWRPSLLPAILFALSRIQIPVFSQLKFLSYASYTTSSLVLIASTQFLESMNPTKELAQGMIDRALYLYFERDNNMEFMALEVYLYFMALKIEKSNEFVKFLIETPNYGIFITSMLKLFNDQRVKHNIPVAKAFLVLVRNLKNVKPEVVIDIPYAKLFTQDSIRNLEIQGTEALVDLFIIDYIIPKKPYDFNPQIKLLLQYKIKSAKILQNLLGGENEQEPEVPDEPASKELKLPWMRLDTIFERFNNLDFVVSAKNIKLKPKQYADNESD